MKDSASKQEKKQIVNGVEVAYTITVVSADGKVTKSCRLKILDRITLEIALGQSMPTTGDPKYISAGEIILNTCWIDGDKDLLNKEEWLTGAAMQAYGLIDIKRGSIKKH